MEALKGLDLSLLLISFTPFLHQRPGHQFVLQATIMAVLTSNGFVDSSDGCHGPIGLVLDTTNFYAEQGGQVADIGTLASSSGRTFDVQDTQASL